jgi:hypothetical protein
MNMPAQRTVTARYAVRMPGALIPARGPTKAVATALLMRRYRPTTHVQAKNAARRR